MTSKSTFKTKLLSPAQPDKHAAWDFLLLPKSISELLPRRGRTSVDGKLNGHAFQATLDPDGQLSHWLKVGKELRDASGAHPGDTVTVEITPAEKEPEPEVPTDLRKALGASPQAMSVWKKTTALARLDWIHWIESAKQSKTRDKRIADAMDMLASGKKRVCCFDPSGFYSKSLSAPLAKD